MPRFVSRYAAHRVVMKAMRQVFDPISRQFLGLDHGRVIEFRNHEYRTEDPEEIAFLRGLPGFGLEIMEAPEAEEVGRVPPAETVALLSTASRTRPAERRCDICGRAFPNQGALNLHRKAHLKEFVERAQAEAAQAEAAAPVADGEPG